jgi:hypothetical protein
MTEEPVADDKRKKHQNDKSSAGASRDGSFQPDAPAVESFNLYLKDENSGLISLVNRDSNLTEQEIDLRQRESISLSELVQRQENGDLIAKSFVSAFQDALKMSRGTARDSELKRLQEVADETFRRGKHAPHFAYQKSDYDETSQSKSSPTFTFSNTNNDNLFPGEKLNRLFDYADSHANSESERQTLLRSELTKIISDQTIQADAIEIIRANGGTAWFALSSLINGTVVNLLAEPGARHSPLFHTLAKTLDAIHRDPQALSKALSILGNQIDISQK